MKFAGWYGIAVGILMIAMWTMFFTVLGVPELEAEPWAIGFHVVAELATAVALIVGGAGILAGKPWGTAAFAVAAGMVIYAVINSSGYFAQRGEWGFVAMFALVLGLALLSVARLWRRTRLSGPAT